MDVAVPYAFVMGEFNPPSLEGKYSERGSTRRVRCAAWCGALSFRGVALFICHGLQLWLGRDLSSDASQHFCGALRLDERAF